MSISKTAFGEFSSSRRRISRRGCAVCACEKCARNFAFSRWRVLAWRTFLANYTPTHSIPENFTRQPDTDRRTVDTNGNASARARAYGAVFRAHFRLFLGGGGLGQKWGGTQRRGWRFRFRGIRLLRVRCVTISAVRMTQVQLQSFADVVVHVRAN